jgi:Zn finger protein HypA/HybF involved in hydrogenase expression
MIIEAKKLNDGTVINKYEVHLECAHCSMPVDAEEYNSGKCSDCGEPWEEKRHVGIHVTSIPMQGKSS